MNTTRLAAMAMVAGLVLWVRPASGAEIKLGGGDKGRPAGPVSYRPEMPPDLQAAFRLATPDGRSLPAQADREGRLWWWQEPVPAGQTVAYSVSPAPAEAAGDRVKVEKVDDSHIAVTIDGKPFTTLNFKKDETKPYLYPVIGPTGDPVTRDWPMKSVPLEKDNGRQDHPHHRSIWTAHGDVRTGDFSKPGANYWHEAGPDKTAVQRVTRIARTVSGPVFGQIAADIDWLTPAGQRDFTETRTYTFFHGDEKSRLIDVKIIFKFADRDVMFADTKEGGILSLRTTVTMDEKGVQRPEAMHGQMTNSRGQVSEKQCWGQPADWCDYVGPVGGKTVGIAVFDHPASFRHPTRWHIREYGLYTANPFGAGAFTKNEENGSHTFKKGETVEFNYRILIHQGDTQAARVADQYELYARPPKVSG